MRGTFHFVSQLHTPTGVSSRLHTSYLFNKPHSPKNVTSTPHAHLALRNNQVSCTLDKRFGKRIRNRAEPRMLISGGTNRNASYKLASRLRKHTFQKMALSTEHLVYTRCTSKNGVLPRLSQMLLVSKNEISSAPSAHLGDRANASRARAQPGRLVVTESD